MRKFIRNYYLEIIAAFLIAGFWVGVWGYHAHQTAHLNATLKANNAALNNDNAETPNPADFNK